MFKCLPIYIPSNDHWAVYKAATTIKKMSAMMIQHNKKSKPSKGNKICPKCDKQSGTRTQGRCKGMMPDGTACTHDWGRTVPKKDREIARLKAELAACGGGDGARLMAENARLMTENARLRSEKNSMLSYLSNDDDIFGPSSLSRTPSLTDISPQNKRVDSLGGAADDSADMDDILRLLTDPVPPSSSETAPQNDVLAEMADVLFKLSKLTHDQQKAALNQIHRTLNYALTPDTHGPVVNPNR